jgi:hypothetical protein
MKVEKVLRISRYEKRFVVTKLNERVINKIPFLKWWVNKNEM